MILLGQIFLLVSCLTPLSVGRTIWGRARKFLFATPNSDLTTFRAARDWLYGREAETLFRHASPAAQRYGEGSGDDSLTISLSQRENEAIARANEARRVIQGIQPQYLDSLGLTAGDLIAHARWWVGLTGLPVTTARQGLSLEGRADHNEGHQVRNDVLPPYDEALHFPRPLCSHDAPPSFNDVVVPPRLSSRSSRRWSLSHKGSR